MGPCELALPTLVFRSGGRVAAPGPEHGKRKALGKEKEGAGKGEEEGGEEGGPAPQDSGHQGEAALLGGDLQGGDEEAHQTGDQARQADGLHAGGYPSRKNRGRMGAY